MSQLTITRHPKRPRRAGLLLSTFVSAVLVLGLPSAALAEPSETGQENATGWYLALGDSLAAGNQPDQTPREDYQGGYVGRTLDTVRSGDPKTKLVNLACSGASTVTMVEGGGRCAYEEGTQFAQAMEFLHAHGRNTELVTLTIGSNDVTPCLSSSSNPAVIQACAVQRLQTVGTNLGAMLEGLRAAAPNAEIVVTNYYNPYLALYFDPARRALVPLTTQLQGVLNNTIAAAAAGRADVADVAAEFSSYDSSPVSAANPTPTNVAVVCAWTWMCTQYQDIHANDAGYAAIARAVAARL